MTKEQANQLKRGDAIFIRARYKTMLGDGDVLFSHSTTSVDDEVVQTEDYTHPENIILPPYAPKYDPCRRFRVGDIVTPIERDGREVPDGAPVGEKCTVVESEKNGIVCIRYDAGSEHYIHEIPYFHLELVTPVEEIVSFRVGDFPTDGELCVWKDSFGKTEKVCTFNVNTHPDAKKAAEAERDRLNAEHRKAQA